MYGGFGWLKVRNLNGFELHVGGCKFLCSRSGSSQILFLCEGIALRL